jgi:WD40 repeat protein
MIQRSVLLLTMGYLVLLVNWFGDWCMAGEKPDVSPERKTGYTDRYGDSLHPGVMARLGSARFSVIGDAVWALAFAPDGRYLVTGSSVTLTQSGNPTDEARAIRVFEVSSGKMLVQFGKQVGGTRSIAISPDGKALASLGWDDTIDLWALPGGKLIRPLRDREDRIRDPKAIAIFSIAFSPDGQTLAAGGDAIELWRVSDRQLVQSFAKDNTRTCSLAYSPDGRFLAAAAVDSKTTSLWAVPAGTLVARFQAGTHAALAFAPDGATLAVGGEEGEVYLWKPSTKQVFRRWKAAKDKIVSIAFSPNGESLAVASGVQGISVWGLGVDTTHRLLDDPSCIETVTFSPDGKWLVGGGSATKVGLWDTKTWKEHPLRGGHSGEVASLVYSPDGKTLASGSSDETIQLWSLANGRELRGWRQPGCARSLAFSANGDQLLSASKWQEPCFLWDVATGKHLRTLRKQGEVIASTTLTPDGKVVAVTDKGLVRVWDVGTGKEFVLPPQQPPQGSVEGIVVSADGRRLAVGVEKQIVSLFERATGKPCGETRVSGKGYLDWQTLALGNRSLVINGYIWDLANRIPVRELEIQRYHGVQHHPDIFTYSRTSRLLGYGSGDTIQVFEAETGGEITRYTIDDAYIYCLTFSPDGRELASGHRDTTILVWDLARRRQRGQRTKSRLDRAQLEQAWIDLASDKARTAFRAVWLLADFPEQAVSLLATRLQPARKVTVEEMERWIADLDRDDFQVRQQAFQALDDLGDRAEATLAAIGQRKPSLEVRKQVDMLLERIHSGQRSPHALRESRALEVLECLATPDAKRLLEKLATGVPESRLTQEAKEAIERLASRPPSHRAKP